MKAIIDRKRLLLLLSGIMMTFIAFAFIFSYTKPDYNRIHPKNGVMNLKNWEPDRDGALSLAFIKGRRNAGIVLLGATGGNY